MSAYFNVMFPAAVAVNSPITLTKSGGTYTLGFNSSAVYITAGQSKLAIKHYFDTAGATSGTENWLDLIEADMAINHPAVTDETNIRVDDAFWPTVGTAWNYVRSVLQTHFAWDDVTTDARMATVQAYAAANP